MQIIRLIFIAALATIASALLTSTEIPILKHKQFQQFIREEGPKSHLSKAGTPTMGGIAIFAALLLLTAAGGSFTVDSLVMLTVTFLFGLIGFLDDYIKVSKKHNLGLRAWQKLVLQILFAVGLAVYMAEFSGYGTDVWVPIIDRYVDFGWMYIPFVAFVVVAMANAVNLTDGLDGLWSQFVYDFLWCADRSMSGLSGFQQVPRQAVHGRYGFHGPGRSSRFGGHHHES